MKKVLLTLVGLGAAAVLHAQTASDAFLFGDVQYGGTARSVGMGNAMTAVGGDLGSLVFNPAGSAVNGYSCVSLTPNISFSVSNAQGTTSEMAGQVHADHTRFQLPGFGFTMQYDTHAQRGIKRVSWGFTGHMTRNFHDEMGGSGLNNATSFASSMAYWTESHGIASGELNASDAYEYLGGYYWDDVLAWKSGMTATYGGSDSKYIACTEKELGGQLGLAGPLNQRFGRRTLGSKYDYIFNFGMNVSDMVYAGINLGITGLDYNKESFFDEAARDPSQFLIEFDGGKKAYFHSLRYTAGYEASAAGLYAKLGVLVTPINGLRIGAAIQTPTRLSVTEKWYATGSTYLTAEDPADNTDYSSASDTPDGKSEYRLRTPMRANVGVAATLGKTALLSVDYEMADYSMMKFSTESLFDDYDFGEVNKAIRKYYGVQHHLRAGAEVRPITPVAFRLGYGLVTSPAKFDDGSYENNNRHSFSLGVGYSSKGSFFADFAARCTAWKEYVYPYAYYATDSSGNEVEVGPELKTTHRLWDLMLTVGWRF